MSTFGPAERELLESGALAVFEQILAGGSVAADDERIASGGEWHEPFTLLAELGLVQLNRSIGAWTPQDPNSVQSRVVSPMSQEAAKLLAESSQWAQVFGTLAQSWRRSPSSEGSGPFTYLHDEAIGPFLTGLVGEAEEEMLTAQPQTGRDPQTLADAVLRDTAMLERGTQMRTLYQHSARRSTLTHEYVAAVAARGAEVRTLDEFFKRLIIVDRRVAVIPASDDNRSAVAVREPSVVAFLVDIFERSWERARPFTSRDSSLMRDIATEQRAMTIRMLIEGHSDPVSAKRLGVSPRTYAGYIADLKIGYEAATRFQLGYTMGREGVAGTEDDESHPQG